MTDSRLASRRSTLPSAGAARVTADMTRILLAAGIARDPVPELRAAGFSEAEIARLAKEANADAAILFLGRALGATDRLAS